jgi:predicted tellurium resistance membrane protein TerC
MEIFTVDNLVALLILTALEIVLGIDNLVVIAIIVQKLEKSLQERARVLGLFLAMLFRVGLLFCLSWIMKLSTPLFYLMSHGFSGRDILLLLGGLFLIGKATLEIHKQTEGDGHGDDIKGKKAFSFKAAIAQILAVDLIFSVDSVITAIGMVENISIMVVAIILAMGVMLAFTKVVNSFIETHPTLKTLALSFILLVGVMLVADGLGQHIQRGYIYFAMGFSLFVETVNIRSKKRANS